MAKITLQLIPYGGVLGATVSSIVAEIYASVKRGHDLRFVRTDGDSLLPRRRSVALSDFFERSTDDVYVTIDHDIRWRPGDVLMIVERALELGAIVGGLYSKRALNQGWGSRLLPSVGSFRIPDDRVIETEYIGSGFMAIPRAAMRKIVEDPARALLTRCWDGRVEYWDFYHTMAVPHSARPEVMEYLSEDWAFSYRARAAGVKLLTDLRPRIVHFGERGFNAADGIPKAPPKKNEDQHASSRPTGMLCAEGRSAETQ